jgi:hypothetical protein
MPGCLGPGFSQLLNVVAEQCSRWEVLEETMAAIRSQGLRAELLEELLLQLRNTALLLRDGGVGGGALCASVLMMAQSSR